MRPPISSLLIVTILAAGALLFQLGRNRLDSWDEAIYAQSAKEMIQTGDWVTPHWNQRNFFQKPPLALWLTALLFKAFGISETTARLGSAIAGIGVVWLTVLLAQRLFDEFAAAFAGLAVLVAAPFFEFVRSGMMDVMLTFFLLLAVYAYVRTKDDERWWLLVGCSSGLAVMTKGAAAAPVLVALAIAFVIDRQRWRREVWLGLAVFCLVALPWHAAMIHLHGRAFLDDYLGRHVLARATSGLDNPDSHGMAYYLGVVGIFLPLLPFGIARLWRERDVPWIIPLAAFSVILIYALSSTRHAWYVIPALPFLAVLIAPARGITLRRWVYFLMISLSIVVTLLNYQRTRLARSVHQAVAELSIAARRDSGSLGVFGHVDIASEVLFYSDRPLCVDAGTPHTMALLATCGGLPQHAIVPPEDIAATHPDYRLVPLAESGPLVYCRVETISR